MNRVKQDLADGGYAIGTWITFVRSPSIVSILAAAGFDFVLIDLQHSDFNLETVADMCGLARARGVVPIVRLAERSPAAVNRILDVGAMGLMFADVHERADIDELRSWMLYPPDGVRGHTSRSAAFDYVDGDLGVLKRTVNEHTLVLVQVESRDAVERIDSLVGDGGVDIVEIGTGDLSTDLGVPGHLRHPAVLAAVDEVAAACQRHGAALAMTCTSDSDAADLVARGVRCLVYSMDRHVLARTYGTAAVALRNLISDSK